MYTVKYRGPLHGLYIMARTDGLLALQSGFAPAFSYQLVMNGIRLGTYAEMENAGFTKNQDGSVSAAKCLLCSSLAGAVGAFVGSPIFLVKTRLQTSSKSSAIAVGYQHKHQSMLQAFRSIYSSGGIPGLWQGATASLPRISIGSAAQLLTYDLTSEQLGRIWNTHPTQQRGSSENSRPHVDGAVVNPHDGGKKKFNWRITVAAAMLSGCVVAVVINPFDVVSTRLYNQPSKKRYYKGYMDCVGKILRSEGPMAFYKGLTAQYFRIGPHSFLSLVFWNQSRQLLGLSGKS